MAIELKVIFKPDLSLMKSAFDTLKIPNAAGLAEQFAKAAPAAAGFGTAAAAAAASLQQQKEALAEMIVSGKTGTAEFKAAEKALQESAAEAKKFEDALEKAEQAAKGVGNETEKASKKGSGLGKMFDFNQTNDFVQKVAGSVNSLTQPFVALDTSVRNIGALGVSNLQELGGVFNDLSTTIPNSAAEIGDAVGEAIGSGIIKTGEGGKVAAEEVKKFADTAAQLAVAGQASIGEAGKGIGSVLNSYGLSAASADRVSKTLFNTFNYGSVTVKDLATYMPQVTSVASSLGVEVEELGGAYATMTKQGLGASDVTTKLKAFMTEVQKPGDELKKVMQSAGLSIDLLKKPVAEGGLTFQDFVSKLKDGAAAAGKGTEIFGSVEAAAVTLSLGGDKAAGALEDLNGVINDSEAVSKGFAVQAESVANKAKLMENAFNSTVTGILNQTGVLGAGVTVASSVFGNLSGQITAIAGLKQIIPAGAFSSAIDGAKKLGTSILSSVIPSLASTTAAGGVTSTAFTTMWAAATGPVGLVIGGIAGVLAITKLLSDALHETAAEKLEANAAEQEALTLQRDTVQGKQDEISKQAELVAQYNKLASQTNLTTAEQQKMLETGQQLNLLFPGTISGSASAADNMAALGKASAGLSDEIIKAGADLANLDTQLADAAKIQIGLEIDVSKENLESELTDALDQNFFDSLKGLFTGGFENLSQNAANVYALGFSTEIEEFFTGTSQTRKSAEAFVKTFSDQVYGAKSQSDIIKAQADFAAKVTLDAEKLGLSKEEQANLIKGFNDFATKRGQAIKQLADADKKVTEQTAATIADTFSKATAGGKGVEDTIKSMAAAFGVSGDKIRQIAFDSELKKATAAGKLTETQVVELAKKYNKTVEEVKKVVDEQKKASEEVAKTKSLVEELAGGFDKAAKAASDSYKQFTGQLNDLALERAKLDKVRDKERVAEIDKTAADVRKKQAEAYAEELRTKSISDKNDLAKTKEANNAKRKASEDALKEFQKTIAGIGKEQASAESKAAQDALNIVSRLRDDAIKAVSVPLPLAGLDLSAVFSDVDRLNEIAKKLTMDEAAAKIDAEMQKAIADVNGKLADLKASGKLTKSDELKAVAGAEIEKQRIRDGFTSRRQAAEEKAGKEFDRKQQQTRIETLSQIADDEKQASSRRIAALEEEFVQRKQLLENDLNNTTLTEEEKTTAIEKLTKERNKKLKKIQEDALKNDKEVQKISLNLEADSLDRRLSLFDIERDEKRKILKKQLEDLEANEEKKAKILAQFDKESADGRSKLEADSTSATLSAYSEMFAGLSSLFKQNSNEYKAMAIFQATIATYEGAAKAISKVEIFPLNYVLAAVVVAQGLANVAKIQGAGFFKGGPTGSGAPHEVKGVVHSDEVVFESRIVKHQERDVLKVREILQSGVKASELVRAFEFVKTFEQRKDDFRTFSVLENTLQMQAITETIRVLERNMQNSQNSYVVKKTEQKSAFSVESVRVLESKIENYHSVVNERIIGLSEIASSFQTIKTLEQHTAISEKVIEMQSAHTREAITKFIERTMQERDVVRSFAVESTASRIAPPVREVTIEPLTRADYAMSDRGVDRIVETLQQENLSLKKQIARFQNDYKRISKSGRGGGIALATRPLNVRSLMDSMYKSQRGR